MCSKISNNFATLIHSSCPRPRLSDDKLTKAAGQAVGLRGRAGTLYLADGTAVARVADIPDTGAARLFVIQPQQEL